jgi:hypothetical protein
MFMTNRKNESLAVQYPRVVVLDVSIGSKNVGDEIIADAVLRVAREVAPTGHIIRLPTHIPLGLDGLRVIRKAQLVLVGGSNLLSSRMLRYRQWKVGYKESLIIDDAILLGVGWWQYQSKPDIYTRNLLKRMLAVDAPQLVRDSYSKKMLDEIGFSNVKNLGCPTLWFIDGDAVRASREVARDRVVTTVTDYKRNPTRDNAMLSALRERYRERFLWLQGSEDYQYARDELDVSGFEILPPSLAAYDALLSDGADFVGTRLHAGIRAMQLGQYARIVPVDNRAAEMGRDFDLPLITFANIEEARMRLDERQSVSITLPESDIKEWKQQLTSLLA